jgi:hypothetical protein
VELANNGTFNLPVDVMVDSDLQTFVLEPRKQTLIIKSAQKPSKIELDPNLWLLFEGGITPK